jgi:hypothetical protein
MEESLTTLPDFQKALRRLDQNLRQIRDRSDRLKTRGSLSSGKTPAKGSASTTAPSMGRSTSAVPSTRPSSRESTPNRDPDRPPRPQYDDPKKQALSNKGACFACGIQGHMAWECPMKDKVVKVNEVEQDLGSEQESGKEQP